MKIAINRCFGGFGLSEKAYKELGLEWDGYGYAHDDKRDDPDLIACIEKLGIEASGKYANIKIVEIPDDVEWEIKEYDGVEWISECHRRWPEEELF